MPLAGVAGPLRSVMVDEQALPALAERLAEPVQVVRLNGKLRVRLGAADRVGIHIDGDRSRGSGDFGQVQRV